MYMFLIQIRRENNPRNILNSHGDSKDWNNYMHQYEDIEKAERECELIISTGKSRAINVRILEVVCIFESEIKVSLKNKK